MKLGIIVSALALTVLLQCLALWQANQTIGLQRDAMHRLIAADRELRDSDDALQLAAQHLANECREVAETAGVKFD